MPKKKKQKSKVVKVSAEVYSYIKNGYRGKLSVDAALRRICGLPSRKGKSQKLRQIWVLRRYRLAAFSKLREAKGQAVVEFVQHGGKFNAPERPMKVREVK